MKLIKLALGLALSLTMGMTWATESTMTEKTSQSAEEQTTTEGTAQATAPDAIANTGTVARAAFTSGIENREPTDKVSNMTNDQGEIMYFTELRDMAGQSVTHRWEHNGKVMAEVPFNISGNRWRVYSSKKLDPSWTGPWKASVVSANGETLSVSTFNYDIAPATPADTPEAAASTAPEAATETNISK